MKKVIALTTILLTLTAVAFASSPGIDPKVENDFNHKFSHAQEVSWITGSNFSKAEFNCQGNWMHAWYNGKGEYLGLTRNISSTQLPLPLKSSLKKSYAQYWITSLVEETGNKGFNYYITLENASRKIVLKSRNGYKWKAYQQQSKS